MTSLDHPLDRKTRRSFSLAKTARFTVVIFLSALFAVPLYIMVSAAFKPATEAGIANMWAIGWPPDFSGITEAFNRLLPNFLNSVQLVIPATLLSCGLGALNGYLLSKVKFRFSNTAFVLLVVGMYIPFQAVLIPMVLFLQSISLFDSILGLILVHVVYGLPITTLIFRNYYAGIPDELVEAAQIDGAGVMRGFFSIFLPLSAPGFVVAGVFQVTNIWNDFLFGLVVVPNTRLQPITVALNNLSGTTSVNWSVIMSGALITAIPTILVYIFLGRFFVKGLIAGSYR